MSDLEALIIPWAEVQPGDLALYDGSLLLISEIRVLPEKETPVFLVAYAGGWHANNDGTVTRRPTYISPNARTLTAVHRKEQENG